MRNMTFKIRTLFIALIITVLIPVLGLLIYDIMFVRNYAFENQMQSQRKILNQIGQQFQYMQKEMDRLSHLLTKKTIKKDGSEFYLLFEYVQKILYEPEAINKKFLNGENAGFGVIQLGNDLEFAYRSIVGKKNYLFVIDRRFLEKFLQSHFTETKFEYLLRDRMYNYTLRFFYKSENPPSITFKISSGRRSSDSQYSNTRIFRTVDTDRFVLKWKNVSNLANFSSSKFDYLILLNVFGLLMLVLAAFILSWIFGYRFFYQDIIKISKNIKFIRRGDYSVRCTLKTLNLVEIRHLAVAFNFLAENLEVREKRIQSVQRSILEKEEVLRSLIDASPDIICLKNAEGRWMEVNQSCSDLFSFKTYYMQGKTDGELADLDPLYRNIFLEFKNTDELAWRMHKSIRKEISIPGPDGQMNVIDVIKVPLYHRNNRRKGMVILGRDISRRKRLETMLHTSKERYKAVLNDQIEMICRVGSDKKINYVNKAFSRAFGVDRNEVIDRNYIDFIDPRDLGRVNEFMESLQWEPYSGLIEHRMITPDGKAIWVQRSVSAILNEKNQVVEFQSVCRDITARRKQIEEIKKLSRAVEYNPSSVMITDSNGFIEYVNPRFSEVTGYTIEAVLGRTPSFLNSGKHSKQYFRSLWKTITSGEDWRGEICNKAKDGSLFWELASITSVKDDDGNIINYVAVKEDITQRKKNEEKIRHLAEHDYLTGLANRLQFGERVKYEIARAKRINHNFALLYLDLDGFKPINDEYGHETGDQVLKEVANIILNSIREVDMASRIGGDEFAIILTDVEKKESASKVARKIIEILTEPIKLETDLHFKLSVSIGISIFPLDGKDKKSLLNSADKAMYYVKSHGKNNYHFYDNQMEIDRNVH